MNFLAKMTSNSIFLKWFFFQIFEFLRLKWLKWQKNPNIFKSNLKIFPNFWGFEIVQWIFIHHMCHFISRSLICNPFNSKSIAHHPFKAGIWASGVAEICCNNNVKSGAFFPCHANTSAASWLSSSLRSPMSYFDDGQ